MGEELWYVKLANGDVHRVTIDQLDGAFQAGHIDESTMVLAAGASQWTKLGDLAGLDDDAAPPVQAAGPISYVPQAAPQVARAYAAPVPVAPRAAPATYTAAAYAQPASYAAPVQQTPYAVAVSTRPAPVAAPYVPNSLRPMSMDLGDLDDMPFQRKSRAGRFVVAVVGLAAIAGGVGFWAQRNHIGLGGGSDLSNVAAAAAIAAPPPVADPVVAPPPPAAPLPAAFAPTPAPSPVAANAAPSDGSPMNPQFTTRLNEDTTKKLLSADKARETKSKSRHSGGGAAPSSHTKSTTFTTGGNKFDPLNSAI